MDINRNLRWARECRLYLQGRNNCEFYLKTHFLYNVTLRPKNCTPRIKLRIVHRKN
jgi:hypothetical protein